jgi:succinyl-diaminopimelate desuccinylase
MDKTYLDEAVQVTGDLIKIPSLNPTVGEKEISYYVERYMKEAGVEVMRKNVLPDRDNIIGRIRGSGQRPALAIVAHMDTVPLGDGWTKPPYEAVIEEGRMYGRGAADMKSGLAASLVTLKYLAQSRKTLKGDFLLCATIDEESHMRGAIDLADAGIVHNDMTLIATEPSNLHMVVAHKGVAWFEIKTYGKNAHAGTPYKGADAAHAMALILVKIKQKIAELEMEDPLVGRTYVSIGRIEGGQKTNVVCGTCRAEIDIRYPPPLTPESLTQLVQEIVQTAGKEVAGTRGEVQPMTPPRPSLRIDPQARILDDMRKAYRETMGSEIKEIGVPYYTDVGMISVKTGNQKCLVFGPGNIEQAHAPDEYVEIDQIRKATQILARTVEIHLAEA